MIKDDVISLVVLKTGLSIDAAKLLVDEAEFAIRNYTGRWRKYDEVLEELPIGLMYIWANLATGIADLSGGTDGSGGNGPVSSIKTGDTTVSYKIGDVFTTVDQLVDSMAAMLNHYRLLYPTIRGA